MRIAILIIIVLLLILLLILIISCLILISLELLLLLLSTSANIIRLPCFPFEELRIETFFSRRLGLLLDRLMVLLGVQIAASLCTWLGLADTWLLLSELKVTLVEWMLLRQMGELLEIWLLLLLGGRLCRVKRLRRCILGGRDNNIGIIRIHFKSCSAISHLFLLILRGS